MNAGTLGLTMATIVIWGLIPIVDKLALAQAPASPLLGIAIRAGAVAVLALPLVAASGDGLAGLRALPPRAIALYATSGVLSLLLAQYTYYMLLRQADVSKVFPLLFAAAPIVTIAIGVGWLGETLSPRQLLGAALVIGGGLLLL